MRRLLSLASCPRAVVTRAQHRTKRNDPVRIYPALPDPSTTAAATLSTSSSVAPTPSVVSPPVLNLFTSKVLTASSPMLTKLRKVGIGQEETPNGPVTALTDAEAFNTFIWELSREKDAVKREARLSGFPQNAKKHFRTLARAALSNEKHLVDLRENPSVGIIDILKQCSRSVAFRRAGREEAGVVQNDESPPLTSSSALRPDPSELKREEQMSLGVASPEGIELNRDQRASLRLASKGYNLYIGGSAGTGKTALVTQLISRLRRSGLSVAVTATTGLAGVHIGGSTFHSAFRVSHSWTDFSSISELRRYDVVIVDEVSMLPAEAFEKFNSALQEANQSKLPFGGIQVILVGDFLQLPPIAGRSMLQSPTFMQHVVHVSLTEQVRQLSSPAFAKVLQSLRLGNVPSELLKMVPSTENACLVGDALNLLPTNAMVQAANEAKLSKLPGELVRTEVRVGAPELGGAWTPSLLLKPKPAEAASKETPARTAFNPALLQKSLFQLMHQDRSIRLPRPEMVRCYSTDDGFYAVRVQVPPTFTEEMERSTLAAFESFMEHLKTEEGEAKFSCQVIGTVASSSLANRRVHERLNELIEKSPLCDRGGFKVGARVLLRANFSKTLVNGSIGTIVDFVPATSASLLPYGCLDAFREATDTYRDYMEREHGVIDPLLPVVRFGTGERSYSMPIPPCPVTVGGDHRTEFYSSTALTVPLTLAYAFTVHKVQGLTLVGRVHLELSKMWPCEHLLYVAMSRVKQPEQLSMSCFDSSMVVSNRAAVEFTSQLLPAAQVFPPKHMKPALWRQAPAAKQLRKGAVKAGGDVRSLNADPAVAHANSLHASAEVPKQMAADPANTTTNESGATDSVAIDPPRLEVERNEREFQPTFIRRRPKKKKATAV